MVVAEIDKDYLQLNMGPEFERIGRKFDMITAEALIGEAPKVRWRTKTDDGDLCYGGWLLNDSESEVQQEVLRYCEHDVGATIIEIKVINAERGTGVTEWVQEIG